MEFNYTRRKKKGRINSGCSQWKKLPRSSDFHQNGSARERTLLGVIRTGNLARTDLQGKAEQKVLE